MGALTPLYAGTMPEGLKLNGKVWHHIVFDPGEHLLINVFST